MIVSHPERRSQGALVTFIDLLFLLVAFFTLLLFFVQQQRTVAEEELEHTQEQLENVAREKSAIEAVIEEIQPFVAQLDALRRQEAERERKAAARELRRAQKGRVKLEYQVTEQGTIYYEGRTYSVEQFTENVVAPLRERNWISFYAYARPETPFGSVVASRRKLLREQGEFDTYWDNLTRQETPEE